MQTAPTPLKVVRGCGAELELADGRQILDCISSWWVTLHGHAEPEIADAIAEQAHKLEQVIFAGFTHEPAEQIANRVVQRLPPGLTCTFFSDNGSTAVEVALKMAMQYWVNCGKPQRQKFIGFSGGYHGDTVGAMSIGGSSPFWNAFRPAMFKIDTVPFPSTFDDDLSPEIAEERSLSELRTLLETRDEYAAVCIEPLIQGAAGMHMCRPQFLSALEKCVREFGVLLIYDEVMTGFGRTGDWFASVKSNTSPDIIAVSKGITGGFLPLSLTVTTRQIYESFLSDKFEQAFFHSHSYTANPIACAAAVASMNLLERQPGRFQHFEQRHRRYFDDFVKPLANIQHSRFCGTIAAFDIVNASQGYFSDLGPSLRKAFLEIDLLLRPLGNTVYLMPPYCISDEQLQRAYKGIAAVVKALGG